MAEEIKIDFSGGDFGIDTNVDLLQQIEEDIQPEPKKEVKQPLKKQPLKKEEIKKVEDAEEEEKEEIAELDTNTLLEDEENQEDDDLDSDEKVKTEKNEDKPEFEKISEGLFQLGIFTGEDTLPKTEEEFIQRFQQEKQKGASEWLNNFLSAEHGEEGIDLFKAIFVDKVDPREYFGVYNDALNLSEVDIESEAGQKQIFREYYTRLGWSSAKIEQKLEKAVEYADLESDAKDFHEVLLKEDQKKLKDLEESSKTKKQQELLNEQSFIQNINKVINDNLPNKEIGGLPLNIDTAKKVVDFLTTKKYQTPDKQKLTEFDKFILETKKPENLKQRVLIALLAQSNFDFSKIEKRAITKKSNTVFGNLIKQTTKDTSTQTPGKDNFLNLL